MPQRTKLLSHTSNLLLLILLYHNKIFAQPPNKTYTLHEFKDYLGKPQVSFTSKGDATFAGSITSGGKTSLSSLEVKKEATFQGDLSAQRVDVKGNLKANSADIEKLTGKEAKLDTITVQSDFVANSNVKVSGEVNLMKDVVIKGKIDVGGGVESNAVISGKTISGKSMTSEEGFQTKDGVVRAKDIEVSNLMKVNGSLKAREAEFNGDITVTQKLSAKTAEMNKVVVSSDVTIESTGSFNVLGKMDVKGDASFSKGLSSMGDLAIRGNVDVNGDLSTKRILVHEKIEASSIILKTTTGKKSKIDASGGSILTDDITANDSIKTKSLSSTSVESIESITTKSLSVSNEMKSRDLEISGKSNLHELSANSIIVKNNIQAEGSISSTTSMATKGDCDVGGTLSSKSISTGPIKSSDITLNGALSADSIHTMKNVTTSGNVHANNMNATLSITAKKIMCTELDVSENLEGGVIMAKQVKADDILSQGSIGAVNMTVQDNLSVGGSLIVKGGIKSKSLLDAESISVEGDISTKGNIQCNKNANITGSVVAESISASFANFSGVALMSRSDVSETLSTSSLHVSKDAFIFGDVQMKSLNINSNSITANSTIVSQKNVTILDSLLVGNSVTAKTLQVNETLHSTAIFVRDAWIENGTIRVLNGTVVSSGGFLSEDGNITVNNILARGDIASRKGVFTSNITANASVVIGDDLEARSAFFREKLSTTHLQSKSAWFKDNVTINGQLTSTSDVNITGNVYISDNIHAKESEFENIKGRSVFSTRIYTEDIVASGFLSAASIISKGDVSVSGDLKTDSLVSGKLESTEANIENSIRCATAKVDGTLEAAGIVVQKVTVKGDLMMNGYEMSKKLEELDELKKRVEEMEKLLKKLQG